MSSFVSEYASEIETYRLAAAQAAQAVRSILDEVELQAEVIASRAKNVDSLRIKVFEKGYKRPRSSVTDLIGVRIITHYRDEVDPFRDALASRLEIDWRKSPDKRIDLEPTQFGYRSVHLMARLKGLDQSRKEYAQLKDRWFEIQIRSLLEHSWAAIEHEVKYKSKISYSSDLIRRFAAIAGNLELLDSDFEALRAARDVIIKQYEADYLNGKRLSESLDTARMIALLSALLPGPGWVLDGNGQRPTEFKFAPLALAALRAAGIEKGFVLARLVKHQRIRRVLRKYGRILGQSIDDLPHLTVLSIVIAERKPRVFREYFPEVAMDPNFRRALSA